MDNKDSRVKAVAFVIVSIAVVGSAYAVGRGGMLSSLRSNPTRTPTLNTAVPPIKFGDHLSADAMRAVNSALTTGWQRALILVIGRGIQDLHAQTAYLQVLKERYRAEGLATLCLTTSELATQSQGLCQSHALAKQGNWAEFTSGRENLLVIGTDGRVEFAAPGVPPPDTMRLVAERFASGRVNYSAVDANGLPSFSSGASLPEVTMTRAGSSDIVRLRDVAPPGTTLIYFGASCSACSIKGYGPALSRFVQANKSNAVILVFATPADDPMVRETLQAAGLKNVPVFEVHSVSTAYATRFAAFSVDSGPLIVTIGSGGLVTAVSKASSGGES